MRGGRSASRVTLPAVLFLLSLPGHALLFVDLLRPSREEIVHRADPFRAHIEAAAREFYLDPALVTAVIAVESKGEPDARSHRGALGLMQLQPGTARDMAALLGLEEPDEEDLMDPALNIRLGAAYLSRQLDDFEHLSLALAAYNAGPRTVRRWWTDAPRELGPEQVIERVAFPETRSYVRRVLAYFALVRRLRKDR